MSTPVTYNAVVFNIPAYQDVGYAQGSGNLSSYLIALATGSLTLSGGTFTLTADANFGANFGLKSIYYKSRAASISSTGILRMARTEFIGWLDQAGTNDLELGVNASDQLTYNGLVIATSTGALFGTNLTLTDTSNQMVIGTTRTVTLTLPTPASTSRVVTIPDLAGNYSVVGTIAAQTIAGVKTFSSGVVINPTTNQLVLGVTNTTTISATAPASSSVYTIPDVGTTGNFILSTGAQTVTGAKTFANQTLLLQEVGSTDVVTINVAALAASRAYTLPDAGASASFVMTEGTQTVNGAKTFGNNLAVSKVDALITVATTSTGYGALQLNSGSTGFLIGQEPSSGGGQLITGSAASACVINSISTNALLLGTSNAIRVTISSAGAMTRPAQPSFLVTNTAGATDVTGDGTGYTVVWNTEVIDQASNFASNTFTAPVTGAYYLSATVFMSGVLVTHTEKALSIVTSNRSYTYDAQDAIAGSHSISVNALADVDVNDTVTVLLSVTGGTKVIDLLASGSLNYFSGSLIN